MTFYYRKSPEKFPIGQIFFYCQLHFHHANISKIWVHGYMFHPMYVHIILEFGLPPFWKITALLVDNMFSLYFLTFYNYSYFPFWSLGLDLGSDC